MSESIWRSQDMTAVQIIMQRDAAHATVEALGEFGKVQFKDLSSHLNAFQRQYANEVRRCEELERILRYFEEQIRKSPIKSAIIKEDKIDDIDSETIESLENIFAEKEEELLHLNESLEDLLTQKNQSEERAHVIKLAGKFIENTDWENADTESTDGDTPSVDRAPLISRDRDLETGETIRIETDRPGGLSFLTGVINRDKVPTFMLLIYRATRGNVVPRFEEIDTPLYDPVTKKAVEKNVFVIFFSSQIVKKKIEKVCESLAANIYEYPKEESTRKALHELEEKMTTLDSTINITKDRLNNILSYISSHIDTWKKKVIKEKATYHTMNMFDYNIQGSVIAEGWIPSNAYNEIKRILYRAKELSESDVETSITVIETTEPPPTYFETNKFTQCFQDITNAYGIPNYKEVNPAVLSIITFPFFFAMMFGDIGHGTLLFIFALGLVLFENQLKKRMESSDMTSMIYGGRYILLLMGIFSIFTGFLYNDMFGLNLNLFGSGFIFNESGKATFTRNTYIFGIDPAWFHTENRLNYYNSIKMKLSIIFGVAQMMVGLFLNLLNFIHFKEYIYIFIRFIPEVIILGFTFGYLSIMIIVKWCIDWDNSPTPPPDLIQTMTDFFLHPFEQPDPPLYNGQLGVQLFLLICVILAIPLLLFPTPFYKLYKNRKEKKLKTNLELEHLEGERKFDLEEEEFSFQEVMIKQLIHTIEFALGAVSNTASYLRLWALSLAHAQLSEVFFDLTIKLALSYEFGNPVVDAIVFKSGLAIFVAFLAWITLTLCVLMGMESLGAFLHSLRLHWVEFQNKFYTGEGKLFAPFSFEKIYAETTVNLDQE